MANGGTMSCKTAAKAVVKTRGWMADTTHLFRTATGQRRWKKRWHNGGKRREIMGGNVAKTAAKSIAKQAQNGQKTVGNMVANKLW